MLVEKINRYSPSCKTQSGLKHLHYWGSAKREKTGFFSRLVSGKSIELPTQLMLLLVLLLHLLLDWKIISITVVSLLLKTSQQNQQCRSIYCATRSKGSHPCIRFVRPRTYVSPSRSLENPSQTKVSLFKACQSEIRVFP